MPIINILPSPSMNGGSYAEIPEVNCEETDLNGKYLIFVLSTYPKILYLKLKILNLLLTMVHCQILN